MRTQMSVFCRTCDKFYIHTVGYYENKYETVHFWLSLVRRQFLKLSKISTRRLIRRLRWEISRLIGTNLDFVGDSRRIFVKRRRFLTNLPVETKETRKRVFDNAIRVLLIEKKKRERGWDPYTSHVYCFDRLKPRGRFKCWIEHFREVVGDPASRCRFDRCSAVSLSILKTQFSTFDTSRGWT